MDIHSFLGKVFFTLKKQPKFEFPACHLLFIAPSNGRNLEQIIGLANQRDAFCLPNNLLPVSVSLLPSRQLGAGEIFRLELQAYSGFQGSPEKQTVALWQSKFSSLSQWLLPGKVFH